MLSCHCAGPDSYVARQPSGRLVDPRTASLLRSDEGESSKRAAVAGLYETHFERVARYIAVRIGDVQEAEDLASEVFVKAVRAADSYKEMGPPMEAWIFKIAHNIVVDHLRKKGRRPRRVPLEEASSMPAKSDPDEHVEREQEIAQLQRVIQQLGGRQQQVLALRFGAGMTSEQVGKVIGKTTGAVRVMQSEAIKQLRKLLAES